MDTTSAPQIFEHHAKSLDFTPFDTKWLPYSAKAVLVGQTPRMTGVLKFFQLEPSGLTELFSLEDVGVGFKACAFNAFGAEQAVSLALGDNAGRLFLFDLEAQKISLEVQAHKGALNCLDSAGGVCSPGAVEVVTGGRDGAVRLWDLRQREPVLVLEPAEPGATPPDCWTAVLGNAHSAGDRAIAAGYDNGDLKLFDLRASRLLWEANLKNGVCGLQFDRKDVAMNKLVAATLEGKVHAFDLRTHHAETGFAGVTQSLGRATLWGVRHLPQNRDVFAVLGGDGVLSVERYVYPPSRALEDAEGRQRGVAGALETLNDRQIAQQPVVGFDWNADKLGLGIACALDQTLKVVIVTRLGLY